ncbi:MAG: hypothetical protein AABW49_02095 [Nanoarchaeota archaeon]|mgnify:CR=1 FL=1
MKTQYILIIVLILLAMPISLGQTDSKACCELTRAGDTCVFTDFSNCDTNGRVAFTSCEQTNFCQLGCCFSSEEGSCSRNTPRASCEQATGTSFVNNPTCDIAACQRGCCLIGDEAFFVTQTQCKQVGSQFPDANVEYNPALSTEASCLEASRSLEVGCCVTDDLATFTTRESCNQGNEAVGTNESKVSKSGFYPNMLCSNDRLQSGCARQHHTECYDGKVYWFDSCGNRENIYDANKDKSYNRGIVLSVEESCIAGTNDPSCGNCDYFKGNLCGEAPRDVKPDSGDLACISLDCSDTESFEFSPSSGGEKKHGESWCVYDYQPGAGSDRPGSRHYRHSCIAGKEMVEDCRDYREDICIQGVIGQEALMTLEGLRTNGGDYVQAACRDNRWEECIKLSNKGECDNEDLFDCFWLEGTLTNITKPFTTNVGREEVVTPPGACVPQVPPGLVHWNDETENVDLGKENVPALQEAKNPIGDQPERDATAICAEATRECVVVYEQGGWEKLFGDKGKCVSNCHCEKRDWILAVADYCQAQGDCGADYNIRGVLTLEGFNIENPKNSDDRLTAKEVDKRPDCKKGGCRESKDFDEPSFFSRLDDNKGWIGLLGLAASGTYSSLAGGEFVAGVIGGPAYYGPGLLKGAGIVAEEIFGTSESLTNLISPTHESSLGKLLNVKAPAGVAAEAALTTKLATEAALTNALAVAVDAEVAFKEATAAVLDAQTAFAEELFSTSPTAFEEAGVALTNARAVAVDAEVALTNARAVAANAQTAFAEAEAASTKGVESAALGSGHIFTILNMAAWAYTIYSLVDTFFTDYDSYTITTTCSPWQAPRGGRLCETCNEPGKPCSEYKCRSLGQTCRLINSGTSDERCINLHPNDVTAPKITPNKDILTKGYQVREINDALGFGVEPDVDPFTPLLVGININEPATCKYDLNASTSYDQMRYNFGVSQFLYNQSLLVSFPAELASEDALRITNGGRYNLYVKCQDASGNKNDKDYLIRFKIKPGPDLTPPIIEATSIPDGGSIIAGVDSTGFSLFLNEPATCKYGTNDLVYEELQNEFSCTKSGFQTVSNFLSAYECTTELENIIEGENNYYFRCKDKAGNVNEEGIKFKLFGTKPLEILSFSPDREEFAITNVTLQAETGVGAENGNAVCGYTLGGVTFEFASTGGTTHTEQLSGLASGEYTIPVICNDIAGNEAKVVMSFVIRRDEFPPVLTQVFSSDGILHIETNEETICEVSDRTFEFGSGIAMTGDGTKEHEAVIEGESLYILCQDIFENELRITVFP